MRPLEWEWAGGMTGARRLRAFCDPKISAVAAASMFFIVVSVVSKGFAQNGFTVPVSVGFIFMTAALQGTPVSGDGVGNPILLKGGR